MSDASILEIDRLAVRRGGRTVIDGCSLSLGGGDIVGVVGKNGCGKSTLLACVAGVLAPRDGRVLVDGAAVWGARRERIRARRALGYVPEGADPPGFLLGAGGGQHLDAVTHAHHPCRKSCRKGDREARSGHSA